MHSSKPGNFFPQGIAMNMQNDLTAMYLQQVWHPKKQLRALENLNGPLLYQKAGSKFKCSKSSYL